MPMARTREPLDTNIQLAKCLLLIFVDNTTLFKASTLHCGLEPLGKTHIVLFATLNKTFIYRGSTRPASANE